MDEERRTALMRFTPEAYRDLLQGKIELPRRVVVIARQLDFERPLVVLRVVSPDLPRVLNGDRLPVATIETIRGDTKLVLH